MSELGQNEGQGQDEKTPFFDSAKISDKKDVEHFSNVEGAEERAKAAERAKKAAEKEAAEVHASDVRAASEQMKQAEKEKSSKKGGILGFLFGGWHKIVTIAILLIVLALAVVFSLKKTNKEEVEDRTSIESYYAELDERVKQSHWDRETYIDAANELKEKRDTATNNEAAYYYGLYYARFVFDNGISVNDSKVAFTEIPEKDNINYEESCELKYFYYKVYSTNEITNETPLKGLMEACND